MPRNEVDFGRNSRSYERLIVIIQFDVAGCTFHILGVINHMQTTWTQPSTVSVRVGLVLRSAEVILELFDLLPSPRSLYRVVVVANIQMRILKAEVEKGSM